MDVIQDMVSIKEAENIILQRAKDLGVEKTGFDACLGRVLAEAIKAERDQPPFNRVAMDGIAIRFEAIEKGVNAFRIKGTQPAGETPIEITVPEECIEIMTGSALPESADTVIRYEDTVISGKTASIKEGATILKHQNIHFRGKDKKQGEVLVQPGRFITPAIISAMASVGKTEVLVKKLPKIAVVSTGNELVGVHEIPTPFQIRSSNSHTMSAVLKQYGIEADMRHLPDDKDIIMQGLETCLGQYDAVLLSGGVSKGKFDQIPDALEALQVEKLFHGVRQRPGKPFWFGVHPGGAVAFAFPGNPVSAFMCFHRYFLPWLKKSWGMEIMENHAILDRDVSFNSPVQYLLQVKLSVNERAELRALPVEGNGSGDFSALTAADAFMELPLGPGHFSKGEIFRIWPFKDC